MNPEVRREPTPAGGDYSEFYLLDKDGNLAQTLEEAVEFRLVEKTNDGQIVMTTYGIMKGEKKGR